jgi:hypothetical protein
MRSAGVLLSVAIGVLCGMPSAACASGWSRPVVVPLQEAALAAKDGRIAIVGSRPDGHLGVAVGRFGSGLRRVEAVRTHKVSVLDSPELAFGPQGQLAIAWNWNDGSAPGDPFVDSYPCCERVAVIRRFGPHRYGNAQTVSHAGVDATGYPFFALGGDLIVFVDEHDRRVRLRTSRNDSTFGPDQILTDRYDGDFQFANWAGRTRLLYGETRSRASDPGTIRVRESVRRHGVFQRGRVILRPLGVGYRADGWTTVEAPGDRQLGVWSWSRIDEIAVGLPLTLAARKAGHAFGPGSVLAGPVNGDDAWIATSARGDLVVWRHSAKEEGDVLEATARSPAGPFGPAQTLDAGPEGSIGGLTVSSDDGGNALIAWANQPPFPAEQQMRAATGRIPGPLTVEPMPLPGRVAATPLEVETPRTGEFVVTAESAVRSTPSFTPTVTNRYRFR